MEFWLTILIGGIAGGVVLHLLMECARKSRKKFIIAFILVHAVITLSCLIYSRVLGINCGPMRSPSLSQTASLWAAVILLFPFGWLSIPLTIFIPGSVVFVPVLVNGYLWSQILWRQLKPRH